MDGSVWSAGLVTSGGGGRAAVALARDGRLVSSAVCGVGRRASEELVPTLDALLRGAGQGPSVLVCVAVATGPGSFTGLRVGVAAAQGMAAALGLRAVGIPSLRLMAEAAGAGDEPVGVACAAGRGEWFVGRFVGGPGGLVAEAGVEARLAAADDLEAFLSGVARVVVEDEGARPLPGGPPPVVVGVEACARRAAILGPGWSGEGSLTPLYVRRSWAEEVRTA